MAKTKDQEKNFAYFLRNANRQTRPDESRLFNKYADQFKRDKKVGDKWVPWNTRTDKPWDNKEVWEIIYENRYGTKTPKEDAKVLRAERLHEKKQSDLNINPLSIANRQLSRKTVNEGERRIDTKREQERLKDEAKIQELRNKSSFNENEAIPEASVDGKPFRLPGEFPGTREEFNANYNLSDQVEERVRIPGEFPGTREEFDAKYGTGGEVGENPNYSQQIGGVDQGYWMDGQWVSNMTDVDRQNLREFSIFKNGAIERKKLELAGNGEHVSEYENSLKQNNENFIDFENTGTGKHWKEMSQWERLQAKVKARGNPLAEARLSREQSTFGVTPWNQPPSVGTKLGEGITQKSMGTKMGETLKKDGDKITTDLPSTAGKPVNVVPPVTKQIPGSSFFPDPDEGIA